MGLEVHATATLKSWLLSDKHFVHPYPTSQERHELAEAAGITPKQVKNWFVNARKRIWQPLLVKMGADINEYVCGGRQIVPIRERDQLQMKSMLKEAREELIKQIERTSSKEKAVEERKDLRRGAWTAAELAYTAKLREAFCSGLLPENTKNSITLRCLLAQRLRCHPMRISKKFSKYESIGKSLYKGPSSTASPAAKETMRTQLSKLRDEFLKSISIKSSFEMHGKKEVLTSVEEPCKEISVDCPSSATNLVESSIKDQPVCFSPSTVSDFGSFYSPSSFEDSSANLSPFGSSDLKDECILDHLDKVSEYDFADVEMVSDALSSIPDDDVDALISAMGEGISDGALEESLPNFGALPFTVKCSQNTKRPRTLSMEFWEDEMSLMKRSCGNAFEGSWEPSLLSSTEHMYSLE